MSINYRTEAGADDAPTKENAPLKRGAKLKPQHHFSTFASILRDPQLLAMLALIALAAWRALP
jgi:hypothetical protein